MRARADFVFDPPMKKLHEQNPHERDQGDAILSHAAGQAHAGGHPDRGGGVDSLDLTAVLQDDPAAEKPHPRDDANRELGSRPVLEKLRVDADQPEDRGAERDQGIGFEARDFVIPKPLQPDQRARQDGRADAQCDFVGLKLLKWVGDQAHVCFRLNGWAP